MKKPFFTARDIAAVGNGHLGEQFLATTVPRVLKNVVRQGKRRVENCGQILFPAGPRLLLRNVQVGLNELEVEKSTFLATRGELLFLVYVIPSIVVLMFEMISVA